jgi:hypothetical protein
LYHNILYLCILIMTGFKLISFMGEALVVRRLFFCAKKNKNCTLFSTFEKNMTTF